MESYFKIANPDLKLPRLSPQQMVDCATVNNGYENMGCQGGFIDDVLDYAQEYPLLEESAYPYEMDDEHMCSYEEFSKHSGVQALSTGGVNL